MKIATITFPVTATGIWLAKKKISFGKGYRNGYGGKVHPGEDIRAGAAREFNEESSAVVRAEDLELVAILDFTEGPKHLFECHVFLTHQWVGDLKESDEMEPGVLFERNNLPILEMWHGDRVWLPLVSNGEKIGAVVEYAEGMNQLASFTPVPLGEYVPLAKMIT